MEEAKRRMTSSSPTENNVRHSAAGPGSGLWATGCASTGKEGLAISTVGLDCGVRKLADGPSSVALSYRLCVDSSRVLCRRSAMAWDIMSVERGSPPSEDDEEDEDERSEVIES